MKINDLNQLGVGGANGSKGVSGVDSRSAQQTTSRGGLRDDRADLSGVAEKVLDSSLETTPERAEKLDRLRQALQTRSYQTDSTLTARGIINDSLGMDKNLGK